MADVEEVKSLCDKRDHYLKMYENDPEYERLKAAYDALPTAYNSWAIEILRTPALGKKPINPFVAAGIGDGIAGLGGAVMMGVAAQNENNKYEQRLADFNKQLSSIKSAGEKVTFLVYEIYSIIRRPGSAGYYEWQREIYCKKISDATSVNELNSLSSEISSLEDIKDRNLLLNQIGQRTKEINESNNKKKKTAIKALAGIIAFSAVICTIVMVIKTSENKKIQRLINEYTVMLDEGMADVYADPKCQEYQLSDVSYSVVGMEKVNSHMYTVSVVVNCKSNDPELWDATESLLAYAVEEHVPGYNDTVTSSTGETITLTSQDTTYYLENMITVNINGKRVHGPEARH